MSRRIGVPAIRVTTTLCDPKVRHALAALDLGDRGSLTLDSPIGCGSDRFALWRGRGRLRRRGGRLARPIKIDIEIVEWSTRSCQLRIHPTSRRALQWGRRRLGRYVDLANLAADGLARALGAAAMAQRTAAPESLDEELIRAGC